MGFGCRLRGLGFFEAKEVKKNEQKHQNNKNKEESNCQKNNRLVNERSSQKWTKYGANAQNASLNTLTNALDLIVDKFGEQRSGTNGNGWEAQNVQSNENNKRRK